MYKLPLCTNAFVMSECWTYYKMAIIQTSPDYEKWIATHLDVFLSNNIEVYFGQEWKIHPIEYFSDILSFDEIDFRKISPDTIINRILCEIKDGNYIILYCNYSKLFGYTEPKIHEVFLFGFDEKEQMFLSVSVQSSGKFEECKIPFSALREAYEDILLLYREDPSKIFQMRQYFYNITRIKLRTAFYDDNYAYNIFRKISRELHGTKMKLSFIDEYKQLMASRYFYSGLGCLIGLEENLREILNNNTDLDLNMITKSLVKLYEHRNMILSSMKWLVKVWDITDNEILSLISQYSLCCKNVQKIYVLLYKCQFSYDKKILERVVEYLSEQYLREKKILLRFETVIGIWHNKFFSYK